MKMLITGWKGMIGSNIKQLLYLSGTYSDTLRLCDLKDKCNLRDPQTCACVTEGCDRVFHLADQTAGLGYAGTHHGQMLTNSLLISLNLLEHARAAGVTDYLYVSSSCVYADHYMNDPVPESYADSYIPEQANEGYGWAKRVAEKQCRYYYLEHDMRTIIVRPANVYGPSYNWLRPVSEMHVIPALIVKMLRGDPEIVVWGNGHQRRTFQYERDTAELIVQLMDKGQAGQAYNLGGTEMRIKDLVNSISLACGYTGRIIYDASKPSGPQRKAQDTSRIEALIPHHPSVQFAQGLQSTVAAARRVVQSSRA